MNMLLPAYHLLDLWMSVCVVKSKTEVDNRVKLQKWQRCDGFSIVVALTLLGELLVEEQVENLPCLVVGMERTE